MVTTLTTIIVKYQMLLLYSSEGKFFTKVLFMWRLYPALYLAVISGPTDQQLDF